MAGKDRKRRRAMYDMILKLNSYQECCDFFDDLCTGKELEALEQRFEVARMLSRNKVYMDIMKETGASSATISRVKRVFSDGTGCMDKMIRQSQEKE
jgi:TrpR-related protein YerC/YecD